MTVVGEAAVRLVLDTKAFQAQLAAISAQINTLGKQFNTLGSTSAAGTNNATASMTKLSAASKLAHADINRLQQGFDRLAKGVTVAGLGIFGLGAGIAAFAGKAAADLQLVTLGFQGLLQTTAEGAKAYTDALVDFAARTPFEIGEVTKATQRLLGAGFDPEQITPMLTKIGDFAALIGSTGAEVNGFVRALAQIQGKGRFTADNVRQLTENLPGLNAMKLIAEQLGITTQEAFAQMEDGALSADVGINALLAGMQEFPGAAGAMDRASRTLIGEVSNLKDGFKLTAFRAAETSGLLESLTKTIDGLGNSFNNGIARDGLTVALEGISTFVKDIGPKLPELVNSLGRGIGAFFESAGPGISSLIQSFGANSEQIFAGIGTVFGQLAQQIGVLLNAIGPLISAFGVLPDSLAPMVIQIGLLARLASPLLQVTKTFADLSKTLPGLGKGLAVVAGGVLTLTGAMDVGKGDAGGLVGMTAGIIAMTAAMGPLGLALGAGTAIIGAAIGSWQKGREEAKQFAADVNALASELRETASNPYVIEVQFKMAQDDFSVAGLEELIGAGSVTELIDKGIDLRLAFKAAKGDTAALEELQKSLGMTYNENIDAMVLPYELRSLESDYGDILRSHDVALAALEKATRDAEIDLNKAAGLRPANEAADSFEKRMAAAQRRAAGAADAVVVLTEEELKALAELENLNDQANYLADVIDYMGGGGTQLANILRTLPPEITDSKDSMKDVLKVMQDVVKTATDFSAKITGALFPSPQTFWKDFYNEGNKTFDLDAFVAKINLTTSEGLTLSDALQDVKTTLGAETYDLVLNIAQEDPAGAVALIDSIKNGDGAALQVALEFQSAVAEQENAQWTQIGITIGTQVANAMIDALDGVLGNYVPPPLPVVPAPSTNLNDYLPDVNVAGVPTRQPFEVPVEPDFGPVTAGIRDYVPEPIDITLDPDARSLISGIAAIPTQTVNVRLRPISGAFALGGLAYNGIPMFKDGGITDSVNSASAGYARVASKATAIFGEAGKEAYVPMRANPTSRDVDIANRLVDHFASKGIELGGGGGKVINFTQNVHGNSGSPDRNAQRFLSIFRNLG